MIHINTHPENPSNPADVLSQNSTHLTRKRFSIKYLTKTHTLFLAKAYIPSTKALIVELSPTSSNQGITLAQVHQQLNVHWPLLQNHFSEVKIKGETLIFTIHNRIKRTFAHAQEALDLLRKCLKPQKRSSLRKLAYQNKLFIAKRFTASTGVLVLDFNPNCQDIKDFKRKLMDMMYKVKTDISPIFSHPNIVNGALSLTIDSEHSQNITSAQQGLALLIDKLSPKKAVPYKTLASQGLLFVAKTYDPTNGKILLELTDFAKEKKGAHLKTINMLKREYVFLSEFFEEIHTDPKHIILKVKPEKRKKNLTKTQVLGQIQILLNKRPQGHFKPKAARGEIFIAKSYDPNTGILEMGLSELAHKLKLTIEKANHLLCREHNSLKPFFYKASRSQYTLSLTLRAQYRSQIKTKEQALNSLLELIQNKRTIQIRNKVANSNILSALSYIPVTGRLHVSVNAPKSMAKKIYNMLKNTHYMIASCFKLGHLNYQTITFTVNSNCRYDFQNAPKVLEQLKSLLKSIEPIPSSKLATRPDPLSLSPVLKCQDVKQAPILFQKNILEHLLSDNPTELSTSPLNPSKPTQAPNTRLNAKDDLAYFNDDGLDGVSMMRFESPVPTIFNDPLLFDLRKTLPQSTSLNHPKDNWALSSDDIQMFVRKF